MISIIIPSFNERESVLPLLKKLLRLYNDCEFIIIDDNSPDGTSQIISDVFKNTKRVRLYTRLKSRGLGTAILYGIRRAKGEIIVGMDADFNHPPEMISKLVKELKNKSLVVASRFINKGGMEDRFRYLFTYFFNLFLKLILDFPTTDNMSGFYAIKKSDLFKLPLSKIYHGYGEYHLRLVWYARKNNLKFKEIPVYYPRRKNGISKTNLFKMFFVYLITAFKLVFDLD